MAYQLQGAIIKTLSYSDIFNYPLTLPEIKKYLIGLRFSGLDLSVQLGKIPFIKEKKGYYYFYGRQEIISARISKQKNSLKKIRLAKKFARLLFFIPTVKLIAVTGNLAMLSADINDDIDLLILTQKRRIWLTRLFCVLILKIFGVYRQPAQSEVSDKICLNMFLDEEHLLLPAEERDLYSAHEIVQMKPLLERAGYENIMQRSNPWIEKFLPNAIPKKIVPYRKNSFSVPLFSKLFDFLEISAQKFQLFYMRHSRTSEVIRSGYLRFHPKDARVHILKSYRDRLNKYLHSRYTS